MYRTISLLIIAIILCSDALAQREDDPIFLHNRRLYARKDNWFTLGGGPGANLLQNAREVNLMALYHYQLPYVFVCGGYHRSSDVFLYGWDLQPRHTEQQLNDIILGTGYRKSYLYTNVAFFAGPTWAFGSAYYGVSDEGENQYQYFDTWPGVMGFMANFEFTYKLYFDLGIGANFYTSVNRYYYVIGFQFHLYFSSALKKDLVHQDF